MKSFSSAVLIAMVTFAVPGFTLRAQSAGDFRLPKSVSSFASTLLKSTDKIQTFAVNGGKAYVILGVTKGVLNVARVLAISNPDAPRVDWDSFSLLEDKYFGVYGADNFHTASDGPDGYTITLRGCARHECSDGKIGFALFSSLKNSTYLAHVATRATTTITPQNDLVYHLESYEVDYLPEATIPPRYLHMLNHMICTDRGFSRPSLLPLNCGSNETSE